MYFTQEDFKKIENWLKKNSVKDSDFEEANPLTGEETVVVVQNGKNRIVKLKDLVVNNGGGGTGGDDDDDDDNGGECTIVIKNQDKLVKITKNGISEVNYDPGYTGLGRVVIDVEIPSEEKTISVTQNNSTTEVIGDNGLLSKVIVNTDIPTGVAIVNLHRDGVFNIRPSLNELLSGAEVTVNTKGDISKDVNFYLPDGTIYSSLSKEDFLRMQRMPNMDSDALEYASFQHWNWDAEEAVDYVSKYGILDVGAVFSPRQGKTLLFFNVPVNKYTTEIYFSQDTGVTGVYPKRLDDNKYFSSQEVQASGEAQKIGITFDGPGRYCVELVPSEGATLTLGGPEGGVVSQVNLVGGYTKFYLTKIYLGDNVSIYGQGTLSNLPDLECVIIPESFNVSSDFGSQKVYFQNCPKLKHITLPKNAKSSFELPSGDVNIPIHNRSGIETFSAPNNCTVTFIDTPYYLKRWCLQSDLYAIQDKTLTNIENIALFEGVTTLNEELNDCRRLQKLEFPSTFDSMSRRAISGCQNLTVCDFRQVTKVTTLDGSLTTPNSTIKIVVPDELYDSWITDHYWSNTAERGLIIKASEYNE